MQLLATITPQSTLLWDGFKYNAGDALWLPVEDAERLEAQGTVTLKRPAETVEEDPNVGG